MLDPEVVVAPGLELCVVLRVVLVTGALQRAVEVPDIILVEVVTRVERSWLIHLARDSFEIRRIVFKKSPLPPSEIAKSTTF